MLRLSFDQETRDKVHGLVTSMRAPVLGCARHTETTFRTYMTYLRVLLLQPVVRRDPLARLIIAMMVEGDLTELRSRFNRRGLDSDDRDAADKWFRRMNRLLHPPEPQTGRWTPQSRVPSVFSRPIEPWARRN